MDVHGLLDAPQLPTLLLLNHCHIITAYHMVRGGCMFGEGRLVVSVCRFLPLVPCVCLPLSDVGHHNSVVFESDIQWSSSLSYVAQGAIQASNLVNGIHGLTCIVPILLPEQVLANGVGRFEGMGYAMHAHCCCCF